MKPATHLEIDRELCGVPTAIEPGGAGVRLETTPRMAVDAAGLVHGGFLFGAADYAAMLAVNDPNVVLGAAETRFLAPVQVGETVVFSARVEEEEGRRREVVVEGRLGEDVVVNGRFVCFVLAEHVLESRR